MRYCSKGNLSNVILSKRFKEGSGRPWCFACKQVLIGRTIVGRGRCESLPHARRNTHLAYSLVSHPACLDSRWRDLDSQDLLPDCRGISAVNARRNRQRSGERARSSGFCSTCLCEHCRSVAALPKSNRDLRQSVREVQALQFLRDLQIVHRDVKPGSQAMLSFNCLTTDSD